MEHHTEFSGKLYLPPIVASPPTHPKTGEHFSRSSLEILLLLITLLCCSPGQILCFILHLLDQMAFILFYWTYATLHKRPAPLSCLLLSVTVISVVVPYTGTCIRLFYNRSLSKLLPPPTPMLAIKIQLKRISTLYTSDEVSSDSWQLTSEQAQS